MIVLAPLTMAFFLGLVNLIYQFKNKNNPDSGFLKEALDGAYGLIYPKNVRVACQNVGLPYYDLMQELKILREPNPHQKLRQMVVFRTVGYISIPLGLIGYILTQEPSMFLFAVALAYATAIYPRKKVEENVKGVQADIEYELPRFVDLLLSALSINMPTDVAIRMTSEQLDGTLAQIMREATAETSLGHGAWVDSLLNVSRLYEVELLSSFILDITTAHEKGLSVVDSLRRKSEDIKEAYLSKKEERAGKIKGTILIPLFIFKVLPIILLLLIPIFAEFKNTGFM